MIQKLVELVFVVYRATIDERISKEEDIVTGKQIGRAHV